MASVERTVSDSSENSQSFQFICHPLPSPDSNVGTSTLPFPPSKVLQPTRLLDHTCRSRLRNQIDLLLSPRAGMPEATRFVHPRSAPGDCGTALPAPVLLSPISSKKPVMDRVENLEDKTEIDQIYLSTTTALSATDIVSKPVHEVIPPVTNFGVTQFQPTLESSHSPLPAATTPVHVSHLRARHLQNLPAWSLPPAASPTPDNAHSQQNMEGTEYWAKQTGPLTLEESSSQRSDRSSSSARSALQKLQTSACLGFGSQSPDHLLDRLSSRNGSFFGENTGPGSPPANSIDRPSTWLSRLLNFERLGIGDSPKVGERNSGSPPTGSKTKLVDDNLEATHGQKLKDGKRKSERSRSHRWLSKLRWRLKRSEEEESLGSVLRRQVPPDTSPDHKYEISLSRAGSARLNSMKTPLSSTNRAMNHNRSMSWASANISSPFTPRQPRLAMRDAQELLMPPKKLPVSSSNPADRQKALKGTELSMINTQTKVLNARVLAKGNDLATEEPCEPLPAADVEVEAPPAFSVKTGNSLDFSAAELDSSQCAPSEGDVQESKNLQSALTWDQPLKSPMSPTTSTKVSQQERLVQSREDNSIPNAECVAATREVEVNGNSSVHKDEDAREGDTLATPVEDVIVKHTVCEEFPSVNPASTFSSPSMGVSDIDHFNLQGPRQARSEYARLTESMNGPNSLPPISFEDIIVGGSASANDNILLRFFFKCREVEDLNKFLRLQKSRLLNASQSDFDECFHLILSSANSGVSSMVASTLTAWLLENTLAPATTAKWHAIPVINMPQHQLWQHRDAAWLFHVCGVDPSALLFVDEITPYELSVVAGRVKRAVIGQDVLITSNEVGSCCTLLAEKFRDECASLLEVRYMKTLLLAGILLDTENLRVRSPRDKEMATSLLVGAGSLGRNGFFNQLKQVLDDKYVTPFIHDIYGELAPLGLNAESR